MWRDASVRFLKVEMVGSGERIRCTKEGRSEAKAPVDGLAGAVRDKSPISESSFFRAAEEKREMASKMRSDEDQRVAAAGGRWKEGREMADSVAGRVVDAAVRRRKLQVFSGNQGSKKSRKTLKKIFSAQKSPVANTLLHPELPECKKNLDRLLFFLLGRSHYVFHNR